MLSKEEIQYGPLIKAAEEFVAKVESGETRIIRSYKAFKEALEGLRSELSVQEGLKDAREAFEDFVTPNGYSIETDPDGEYACPEVRLQKYAFMAGARHNAASALEQKREVVWEGKGCIVNGEHMTPELYVPSFRISNAGLKVDDLVHVTISLPQQEQE